METVKEKQVKTDNELIDAFYVSQGGKPSLKEDLWFYESDWNMLMSVVEKIESLGYCACIYPKHCDISVKGTIIEAKRSETKIQATYEAVTVFIKWYNTQALPPYKTIK